MLIDVILIAVAAVLVVVYVSWRAGRLDRLHARVDGARAAGPLLEDIALFDVYTGEQAGEGRKSLTYTLRFRADDRTLTAEEASAAREAAVAEAAKRVGAVLRGA